MIKKQMMDLRTLKLQIINRIIETHDAALLQTVAKILDLQTQTGFPPEDSPPQNMSEATRELQRSIDEIFGSEK